MLERELDLILAWKKIAKNRGSFFCVPLVSQVDARLRWRAGHIQQTRLDDPLPGPGHDPIAEGIQNRQRAHRQVQDGKEPEEQFSQARHGLLRTTLVS